MSKPGRTISNKCPHCGESLWIRSSEQVDPLLKRLYGQCTNLHCGFTAQGFLTWDAELSPSAVPNPNIHLPRDRAQENQLNQVKVKPRDYSAPSLSECEECGNDIPPERQKLGAVTLCIECKTKEERHASHYR